MRNIIFFSKRNSENKTVVSLITSALRRDISFGELQPDKKLKIEELRKRYGGSGHSVREALTLLSTEGLVEATAQRGFRVASATDEDLRDIIRLRLEIECLALKWSLENTSVAWESRVVAAHHTLSRAQSDVIAYPDQAALEWDEAARVFHAVLVEACGSTRLISIQQRLYDQSRRFRLASLREGALDFEGLARLQQLLVDSILKRDVEKAISVLTSEIEIDLN